MNRRTRISPRAVPLLLPLLILHLPPLHAAPVDSRVAECLAVIARAGPQGTGSAAAREARDELARHGVEILPQLLAAMDTSNPVAANWCRTVYEEIVDRGFKQEGAAWPREFLKEYVSDARRAGRPRDLALSLLERLEPGFRDAWLPGRLDDPPFRHQAVALALAAGDRALREKNAEQAKIEFRKAFDHARDSGQLTQAASNLKALGEPADVIEHLGLIIDWWLVGPFDAPDKSGFAAVFEPENRVDLAARYKGKAGEIRWTRHTATDPLGQLNLIEAVAATREAVGYAYTEIDVPHETAVQLRCGADDNCTVWLNGKKVFGREQWLNGTRFDRFISDITLKSGRNTLLVKICQGPQHKDPEVPNNWSLQLRLCDESGKGIGFKLALRPAKVVAPEKATADDADTRG